MVSDVLGNAGRDRAIGRILVVGAPVLGLLGAYSRFSRRVRRKLSSNQRRMAESRREFYANMWREAAEMIGAQFTLLDDGSNLIEKNGQTIRVQENITSLDPAPILRRAKDKLAIRAMLVRSGIAVPKCIAITVDEFDRAVQMLKASPHPIVVKPADATSGGEGVTTNVSTVRQLGAAVAWARSFSPRILIEEQLAGDCYRVLVMDGKVLDVVLRHPPAIVSDGRSTILQLINRENRVRLKKGFIRAQCLVGFDPDLRNTLRRQNLTLSSRLSRGTRVVLKQVINDNNAGDNEVANDRLCRAILSAACDGARILGARMAGVDIICSDPKVPFDLCGGGIIEVNATPGLYYHYNKGRDDSAPMAERVLNRAFGPATDREWLKARGAQTVVNASSGDHYIAERSPRTGSSS